MEDDQELDFDAFHAAPALVSLAAFSPSFTPSSRRLSSHFSPLGRPVPSARQLAWVSLQGRLIGAEEASSVKTIGGSLNPSEALAWELFSPIHRILIVAVVAVATAELKKSQQICQLKRSVLLRDQVLSSMQQKLDDLCNQVNIMKEQPENEVDLSFTNDKKILSNNDIKLDETTISPCGCQVCYEHRVLSNGPMCDFFENSCCGDEVFKFKIPSYNVAEQEERRMSNLSDWASSVNSLIDIHLERRMSDLSDWSSSVNSLIDIQLNSEQDIYNLQQECDEKDATIKELSASLNASDAASSKRIAELEDVIRRKNMIITKLKKDMAVLEQKVVHLTRLRRPSFTASNSNISQPPIMADNLLYDMESSTSPSSSDPDSPIKAQSYEDEKRPALEEGTSLSREQTVGKAKAPISLPRLADSSQKQRQLPMSPLNENSMNHRLDSTMKLRQKQLVPTDTTNRDMKRIRRHTQTVSKDKAQPKRRV
ncbi:uncharacterized protein LOC122642930 [Telopea speciosissima]|uniref:uncharacterized protein LOC122642930 n=1 Tax=Telopea speciosissima TaxID=54955 RepID=UPI001CC4D5D8|nr:uncharacterized protein LOC122642930 [Telopea speciosissima]